MFTTILNLILDGKKWYSLGECTYWKLHKIEFLRHFLYWTILLHALVQLCNFKFELFSSLLKTVGMLKNYFLQISHLDLYFFLILNSSKILFFHLLINSKLIFSVILFNVFFQENLVCFQNDNVKYSWSKWIFINCLILCLNFSILLEKFQVF